MTDVKANEHHAAEQQPVPDVCRPALRQVVDALARRNYNLEPGIPGVEPISASTAFQVYAYLKSYGASLMPLPEEAWESSVCIR